MGNVVALPAFHDERVQRARFEAWATKPLSRREATEFMARKPNGEYYMASTKAAWAAWQARGLHDAEAMGIQDTDARASVSEVPLR